MSDKPLLSLDQYHQQLVERLAEAYGMSVTEIEKTMDEWNKECKEEIRQVCGVDPDKQVKELLEEQHKMVEKLKEIRQREKAAEAAIDICQRRLSPNAIKEYHSPAWHQPVTPEEIEYCEKEFGPLVNTLAELANLVREVARCAEPNLDPNKYYIAYCASGKDPGTDKPSVLSPNTYQLVLRAHISARYLGLKIEMVAGKKHATEFYDYFRSVLAFMPNREGPGWAWLSAESKNSAQELEHFHRIFLLLIMPEVPYSKQRIVDVKDSEHQGKNTRGAGQGNTAENKGEELSKDGEMSSNYIPCIEIAGIIRKRSDAIARTLKAAKYPVIKKANKNYCDPEHAAVLFPKWKKHLKEQRKNE